MKLNHIRIPDPSDITLIGETEYLRQAMVRIEEALNNIDRNLVELQDRIVTVEQRLDDAGIP